MYIISKHRDYYDKVAGTVGIDKQLIYKRELVEFEKGGIEIKVGVNVPCKTGYKNDSEGYTKRMPAYVPFIIGFCGRLYVGYKFSWQEKVYGEINMVEKTIITYDKNKIEKLMTRGKKNDKIKEIKAQLANTFGFVDRKQYDKIFQEHKVPYFYASYAQTRWGDYGSKFTCWKLNPVLSDYDFVKKFDPFMAFQEIAMYIGGVLGTNENETVEIDEQYRMASRGFDKTSFRQAAPGDRKERRKANKLRKRLKNGH